MWSTHVQKHKPSFLHSAVVQCVYVHVCKRMHVFALTYGMEEQWFERLTERSGQKYNFERERQTICKMDNRIFELDRLNTDSASDVQEPHSSWV